MKKYDNYEPLDSSRIFLKIIIYSFVLSLALTLIYSIICAQYGITINEFNSIEAVALINAFIMEIFFVVIYFLYMQRYSISVVKANRLNKPISWQQIAIIIVLMGFIYVLSSPFCTVFESFLEYTGYKLNELNIKLDNPLSIILCLLFLGIIPGFIEEFIFRGAILQGLKKYGKWFAIIVSSLLFMLIHGNIQQTIYQFGCGVIFGILVWETGSIWSSIIIHCANNTLGITLQSLVDCGVIASTTTEITWIYVLLSFILIAILVFIVIFAIKLIKKYQLKNVNNLGATVENNVADYNQEINGRKYSANPSISSFKQGYLEFKKDNRAFTYLWTGIIISFAVLIINTLFS